MKTENKIRKKILVVISDATKKPDRNVITEKYPQFTCMFLWHRESEKENNVSRLKELGKRGILYLDASLDPKDKLFYRQHAWCEVPDQAPVRTAPPSVVVVPKAANGHPPRKTDVFMLPESRNDV